MQMYDVPEIERIIEKAKEKFPVSFQYKGKLYEKEIEEIEKACDVRYSSVYMDGSGYYYIRYRKDW